MVGVTPSGEAGQWGPRPSHCGRWHWTVTADLSPFRFRVVLGFPSWQLDWLSYVPIRGLPLELRCPVAMTSILLLVISGDFYLQYYMVWDCFCTDWDCLMLSFLVTVWIGTAFWFPFWVLYWFGTAFSFPFLLLYGLGLLSRFLFWVLYKFGTVFLIEYYTSFRPVLSQVGSVPQMYLRSFEVEEKP